MKREEILDGLRRQHRMHMSIDPTCSHAPDCAGCLVFDNARSALTREPAPCPHRELEREALKATLEAALRWTRGSRTGWSRSYLTAQLEARIAALAQPCAAPLADCENIEPGLSAHGGGWQRCTDREPDDLGTWCDWCRHRGVVQHVDDGSPPFPEPAPCPHRELMRSCSVILNQFAPREEGNDPWGRQRDARVETLRDRVDAALASTQPCAAPAGCQHRERLREAFDALPRECCATSWELLDRIEATLKQPCAAPGEAGEEWRDPAKYEVSMVQHATDLDRYVVHFSRRAPEREGGAR